MRGIKRVVAAAVVAAGLTTAFAFTGGAVASAASATEYGVTSTAHAAPDAAFKALGKAVSSAAAPALIVAGAY